LGPIPNPQSPIPNPQSPLKLFGELWPFYYNIYNKKIKNDNLNFIIYILIL